ncbi:MAG TPA: FISUMP domain-containing protein [Bacteroidales bacterium]|nr:FISUMP domain-containing protein [Bacteroidales bacterium]HPS74761.1 FISUMP domain-containing protein [Bacteroidales bacterium]
MKYFYTRDRKRHFKIATILMGLLYIFSFLPGSFGQPFTTCTNSNFNMGTFKNWGGCYGYFGTETLVHGFPPPAYGPCYQDGFLVAPEPPLFDKPLHRIIQAPGWMDSNSCDSLSTVFPGEDFVARIGDTSYTAGSWTTGKEAELHYQVNVSNNSYLFIYRYAVVLENGGHDPELQPDFQVMITNDEGTVLDSTCGYYYICAPPTGQIWPGWHSCITDVSWKDWTTVGMNLTPYYGQTVNILFKVRGCYYDTHFGYAYISAYCGYLVLQTALCEGQDSAVLTAPPGFSYVWFNGAGLQLDTVQSITVPAEQGALYSCKLTAVNGCQVTISVNLSYTIIHTGFTYGSACAGIPVQFNDTTWVSQNYVEEWKWYFGDGDTATGVAAPLHIYDTAGTYTVRLISYSTEGCSDTAEQVITVAEVPHITNSPLVDTLCSKASTNLTLTADLPFTWFTWVASNPSGNISGFSNNSVPASILNDTLINTGEKTDTVFYTISPHAGSCTGPDSIYRFLVKPLPTLTNTTLNTSICDSSYTNLILSRHPDSTRFTWTCTASSSNLSGYSGNIATPDTLINQLITNSGITVDTVYYHIVPWLLGCPGDTSVFKVAVYPDPDLSITPVSKSICNNTGTDVTLTSNVPGTLFTWTCTPSSLAISGWSNNAVPTTTLNQVLTVTGNVLQTVIYHITPHKDNCPGDVTDYTVTVFPTPLVMNAPMSKNQCDSVNTLLALLPNIPGTLYTWTCTPGSLSITGYADSSIPDDSINQWLFNSSYLTQQVTYHIVPHYGTCIGNDTDFVVRVFPVPDLSNTPPASSVCNNVPIGAVLTSNVDSTMFTWTCTPSSSNITGWSNNVIPTVNLNQTLINSGLTTEWVIYHMTPIANGCYGHVTDYTVTVIPSPDVYFNPPAQTICSGDTSSIQILSSVPGATFSWTVVSSSSNLTGQSAGSGSIIAQIITNSGNTIENLTYTVTPESGGCPPGASVPVILTVNPSPIVNNSDTMSQLCSAGTTNISPTSSVPGSTFSWTAIGSSGNVSGFSNGAGPSIIHTLFNAGNNIETVTYFVTATANSCPGVATPFVVTVFPVAAVVFTPNGQSICSGQTTAIALSSGVAGASFTWTATGSGPSLSGFSAGSGNSIQQTLFNSGPYPQTASYIVIPTANNCPGITDTVLVAVNPWPSVTFTPCFDQIVSFNAQSILLKGGLPPGGAYSGAGVTAGFFDPSSAGAGPHTITYTYINYWGCSGSATAAISVVMLAPFNCGNPLTDIRDNQVYQTIRLGTQCWLSQNLNYGNMIGSNKMQLDNCLFEKYCYGDNAAGCLSSGGMYQWDELMQYTGVEGSQGFCPPEWHVPTENDWIVLFSFYYNNGFAGSPLKATGYSGFDAFLQGARFNNVQFNFNGFAVMFWSSTPHGPIKAWAHGMNYYNPSVSYYPSHRNNALFTRCIKD